MLELGDIVVHPVSSHLFATHGYRDGQEFNIHERSIFAATPGDGVNLVITLSLLGEFDAFRMQFWCVGNQVV
jgi:hypothetical protein